MTLIASPSGQGLLTSYDDLVAAIVGWLHREDLRDRVPTFIALAEASINRIAQVAAMESEVPLPLDVGARAVALPDGLTTPLAVWIDRTHAPLSPATPEELPVSASPGCPTYWAIDGSSIAFNCPADVARTVTLRYRGAFRLGPDVPINALLTKYPDLYLYGALLQSAPYVRDMDSIQLWRVMYDRAVKEINAVESRARAAAPLRTELAGVLGRCGSDFYRGY